MPRNVWDRETAETSDGINEMSRPELPVRSVSPSWTRFELWCPAPCWPCRSWCCGSRRRAALRAPPPTLRPAALPGGTGISTLAVAHTARKEAWDMIAAADYPGWRRETLEHV